MSENQYLEIIENKLDAVTLLVEQQAKSGVFFDGFTKQVLEKIHNKLEYISNFETNELITYLTEELRRNLEERHHAIQDRLDGVQGQINQVQANLTDSLKTPEIANIFTKLSDSILGFSRDLGSQTRYFNSTVEEIKTAFENNNVDEKINNQTNVIKNEIDTYKTNLDNLAQDINSGFSSVQRLIENNAPSEAIVALSGDISVIQKGLNDIINAVIAMNGKQGDIITGISNISASADVQDIRLDVSSIIAEMQALKESVRVLVNKSDIEALNEKLNYAIETVSNLKEISAFNDNENKSIFNSYFSDLTNLVSSLVSKEEGELIKSRLELIQTGLESGKNSVEKLIEDNKSEIRNLIPVISSLSTQENLKEMSDTAIEAINRLTAEWNEKIAQNTQKIDEKFENFKSALSDIYEALSGIGTKIDASKGQNEFAIKDEINSITAFISEMSEQVSSSARNSVSEMSGKFGEISNLVSEKIGNLESLVSGSQNSIKEDLSGSISQLKDFSQNLINTISAFEAQLNEKTEEIKLSAEEKYNSLLNKVENLTEVYSVSNVANKSEILAQIGSLKELVEASKSALDNDVNFAVIKSKLDEIEPLLQGNRNEILASNSNIVNSIGEQTGILEQINNSIKDLYINISDGRSLAQGNKEEVLNTLADKVSSILGGIETAKIQISEDLTGNQQSLSERFDILKEETEQIKTILSEVNANQASKQILAAILESVTGKLESVSVLINQNKDYTLEQYDGIKNLTNSLKSDISDVVILLNHSAEFAQNMLERISSGFVEVSGSLAQQIAMLKNDLSNSDIQQKLEIIKKIEDLESQLLVVQRAIESFNFDESVKEQLLELKTQIQSLNQQSLGDILNSITADNEKTGSEIKETVSGIKSCFDDVLGRLNLVHAQGGNNKEELTQNISQNFNSLNQKVELLVNNLQNSSYDNKEQILGEISNLKNSAEDLKAEIQSVGNGMLKNEFVVAQIDRVEHTLSNLSADFCARLDDISNTDKGYVSEAVKSAMTDLQAQILESINYLKGLNLNLDRSIAGIKNEVIDEIISLKDSSSKNIDIINNAKDAVISIFEQALSDKTIDIKSNLETKIQDNFDRFDEKISIISNNIQSSGSKNKEQIISILEELKKSAENVKSETETAFEAGRGEMIAVLNAGFEKNSAKFEEQIAQTASMLQNNSAINKEQIENSVLGLKNAMEETKLLLSDEAEKRKEEIKAALDSRLEASLQSYSDKTGILVNTVQNIGYRNKEQIIEEITSLKSLNEDIKGAVAASLDAQTTLINEQVNTKFDEIIQLVNSQILASDEVLKQAASDNKNQIVSKIEGIKSVISGIKDAVSSIFEDKLTGLSEDIKNKFDENTQNQTSNVSKITEELKSSAGANKDDIINEISSRISQIDEKILETSEKIQSVAASNKTDLSVNIANVQSVIGELKAYMTSVEEKLLKEDTLSSEIERIDSAMSRLTASLSAQTEEASRDNADKVIGELQPSLISLKNEVSAAVSVFKQSVGTAGNVVADVKEELASQLGSIRDIVEKNSSDLAETTSKLQSDLSNSISALSENIEKSISSKDELFEAFSSANEELEAKLSDNSQKVGEMKAEIKQMLGNSMANISEKLSQNKQSDDEFKESIKYELQKSIENITDKLFKADEDNSSIKSELLFEFQKSYNILSEKLDDQKEKAESLKSELGNIVNDNLNIIDEKLQNKYNKLQAGLIKDIAQDIDIQAVKAEICKDILENSANLSEKVDEVFGSVVENKEVFEKLSNANKESILTQIRLLKEDISGINFDVDFSSEIKHIEDKFDTLSDNILDALSNDLDASFTENIKVITETIEDKVSYIKDDIQEIVLKISELDLLAQKVKEIVTLQFEEYFESFNSRLTNFGDDLRKYVEKNTDNITETIQQYQKELQSLSDIDLSGYHEDTKKFVQEQIRTLAEKVQELKNNNDFTEVSDEIKNTVISSSEHISKRLEILRDIIISDMPDGEEIVSRLEDIQAAVDSVNKNTESLVKSENASLKDVISRYRDEINAISDIDLSSLKTDTQDFISKELKQLKEQFVINLTSVFENISFIEESEELQNVISDNTDEIKNEINKLKDALVENSNSSDDIDEKFDNLKSILESITTGASSKSDKYIYTLPDVETDIAKMRIAINDITGMLLESKDEGLDVAERLDSIDSIRDDISSISKRTNKLILTSEDANKHLKENLADFKEVIEGLGEKFDRIDSNELNRQLSDVKALVMSSLKSDKILNEAFMYLAEWIDNSADSLNKINEVTNQIDKKSESLRSDFEDLTRRVEKLDKPDNSERLSSEIEAVKQAVAELASKPDKKPEIDYSKTLYEIEYNLDKISDKMDVQELKIKALEKKLDSFASTSSDNQEMSSILEFIASQVSAANENSRSSKLLLQKVEAMEKQMRSFEQSIAKITAFVDEDN